MGQGSSRRVWQPALHPAGGSKPQARQSSTAECQGAPGEEAALGQAPNSGQAPASGVRLASRGKGAVEREPQILLKSALPPSFLPEVEHLPRTKGIPSLPPGRPSCPHHTPVPALAPGKENWHPRRRAEPDPLGPSPSALSAQPGRGLLGLGQREALPPPSARPLEGEMPGTEAGFFCMPLGHSSPTPPPPRVSMKHCPGPPGSVLTSRMERVLECPPPATSTRPGKIFPEQELLPWLLGQLKGQLAIGRAEESHPHPPLEKAKAPDWLPRGHWGEPRQSSGSPRGGGGASLELQGLWCG